MAILTPHKHTMTALRWYFVEYPSGIVRGYCSYARALMEIIPLPFLLLTLIAPWKNIRERKTEHGFNIQLWFERVIFNLFSRTLGAVVRILTMILGVLLHAFILCISVAYLLGWLLLPAITVTAVVVIIRSL